MKKRPAVPTTALAAAYQRAFDHFNRILWAAAPLPPVVLNFSRHARANGFFAPERWSPDGAPKERVHEISINPETLEREPRDTLGTLVHEMAHLWQQTHGTPSRSGYHNQEWVKEMRRVGLDPVSLDSANGTGQRVTHTIRDGGAFDLAFKKLPEDALFPFRCSPEAAKKAKKPNDKVAYECPDCEAKVWGKPGLHIVCGDCEVPMGGEGGEDSDD